MIRSRPSSATGKQVHVESLTGDAARARFDDLARLRITVFRDFPYLYDGDLDYERRYLETYARSEGGVVVVAWHGDRAVGAATALPLRDETDNVVRPFRDHGFNVDDVFYLGESVLLPEYRGHGIGHAFFDHREAHARALGCGVAAFCAVVRPADHPRRPADYRPLDAFWLKRGYRPRPDMTTTFSWRDLDDASESEKPMQFWVRRLAGTP